MSEMTILVVEDEPPVREIVTEYLTALGYGVIAVDSAEAALDALEARTPDLILTDVHLGSMTGVELCKRVKSDPRWQLIPLVILTGVSDLSARVAGLDAGADDFFGKPVEFSELRARVASLLRVKSLVDQLERAEEVITTLGLTIEARDPYTLGHCERLSDYAVKLGHAMGVPRPQLKALRVAGYLHDVGKIVVPDGILLKTTALSTAERDVIKAHPSAGADLVRGLRTLEDVRPIIRHHHERLDGSGYPDGLAGEAIPLGARIMAVVDVYDALVTTRSYKPAFPHARAIEILRKETDAGYWEPNIVTAFEALLADIGADRPR
jgi:putative two-component system response regulator